MTVLHETIRVTRPIDEAFAYIADFSNSAQWDRTVHRARKLTPGPVAAGSRFAVTCKLPLGSVKLDYHVTEFNPPERLVLTGSNALFRVQDTIELHRDESQTAISYQARFEFHGVLRPMATSFTPGLERMGAQSVAGLRAALEQRPLPPAVQRPAKVGSITVVPRFSRLGYRRSRSGFAALPAHCERHIVITGATAGLGLATARDLAGRGARLTLVCRDPDRGEALRDSLVKASGNRDIRVELADLSLLADTQALGQRLRARGEPIDVLVNNAGALFPEHGLTPEGHERSLALLLLSPWVLTLMLKPLLANSDDARVVNVVSGGMYTQRLDTALLAHKGNSDYNGAVAYARAKRALMTVTQTWAGEWAENGIAVNAMHPGWADTPGVRAALPRFHRLTRPILRTCEEGADTIIWQALAPEARQWQGQLFLDRQPQPLYLNAKTVESAAERQRLLQFLAPFRPATS